MQAQRSTVDALAVALCGMGAVIVSFVARAESTTAPLYGAACLAQPDAPPRDT